MWMSDEQVCRLYRESKESDKQIKIIAEANGVSEGAVREILLRHGAFGEEALPRDKRAVRMYRQGMTADAIADRLGVAVSTVQRYLRETGYRFKSKRKNVKVTDEMDARMRELYKRGLKPSEIGYKMGLSKTTVCLHLRVKENRVKTAGRGAAKR